MSWSHYRELLSVNEVEVRKRLADETIKNDWTRDYLRREIKKLKSGSRRTSKKAETLKAIKPGTLDVFRTREVNGKTLIDLGFSTYLDKKTVKIGAVVKIVKDRNFIYRAAIEAVVDGDTLWCVVDLGLGVRTRQKLRLAGLNAPELRSQAGIAAKRFLSGKLKTGSTVIIATTKSDKFDRYLVDVWLDAKTSKKADPVPNSKGNWEYLNKTLVDEGYANVV